MVGQVIRRTLRFGIRNLPFPILYEAFYQSARALGIESYEVSGTYGRMFGSLYDQTAIKGYLRSRTWSPYIVRVLKEFFATSGGGTFYDVGANIGLITIPLAQDSHVTCVAFEPDPENFRLLRTNLLFNCTHANVTAINAAVYAETTELRFSRSEYNSGDHRVAVDGTMTVKAVTLDSNPPAPGPFALKIDTQGAEPAVFAGGTKTLRAADLIVAEFWPWGMSRLGLNPEPMISQIDDLFPYGQIVEFDKPGAWSPISAVTKRLREIVSSGGEHDSVDLVLSKRPMP